MLCLLRPLLDDSADIRRAGRDSPVRWRPALMSALLLLGAGCEIIHGSGHVVEEERKIGEFARVVVEGEGTVRFTQGDDRRLVVEAEDNVLDALRTRVENDELVLTTRSGVTLYPTRPIRFHLQAPGLRGVGVTGSGTFESSKPLDLRRFDIDVVGSGEAHIEQLKAEQLTVDISGSGRVNLKGDVDRQEIDISGSGDYRAKELKSTRARLSISGSGNAEVHVSEQLTVDVSGSGDVRFRGDPDLSSQISGSGTVRSTD